MVENCGNVSWNWWYSTGGLDSGANLLNNMYTGNS
jgi:hypothetical protein